MSHFSVLVRLPADVQEDEFEDVIEGMMLPYKESGAPPQYLEFDDEEDEHLKKYETESSDMVRLKDGQEISRYDEQFRNSDWSAKSQFILPPGAVEFEAPHKERFATFEKYMEEYCGFEERDPKKNRYGYWRNPNSKWDWWTIGGRWTGHLLIGYDPAHDKDNYKPCWLCGASGTRPETPDNDHFRQASPAGHPVIGKGCNACRGTGWDFKFASDLKPVGNHLRVSQLNWEQIYQETLKRIDKFWDEWQKLCDGVDALDPFGGPRETALSLGLLECKDKAELTGNEWKIIPWDNPETPEKDKRNRFDVLKLTTKDWLVQNCADAFSPISSWARLDDTGWKEKGEMGWWGMSSATPESTREHAKGLKEWLKAGNQEDWLVVCDCHI